MTTPTPSSCPTILRFSPKARTQAETLNWASIMDRLVVVFTLRELLERHYLKLPPEEFYARLHRIQPQLNEAAASMEKTSDEMRREFLKKAESLVASTF